MGKLREKGIRGNHIIYINFEFVETKKKAKDESTFGDFVQWGGLSNRVQFCLI